MTYCIFWHFVCIGAEYYASSEILPNRTIYILKMLFILMQVWRSGRVVGYRSNGWWFAPSPCSLVFRGHRASNVKLRILECFTLYLRNRQSGNLRAIENCICGLRSIERNMRSFLRTVRVRVQKHTVSFSFDDHVDFYFPVYDCSFSLLFLRSIVHYWETYSTLYYHLFTHISVGKRLFTCALNR